MSDPIQRMVEFAKRFEPEDGYFGPLSFVEILEQDSSRISSFSSLFEGVSAEQLEKLEEDDEYGWIVEGAADSLDLLPDDPRLFKTAEELAQIPKNEMLGELCSASIVNDIKAVEFLASRINVNQLDHNKQSALGYAIGNNHPECVKILLANGADPNQNESWGHTAMHTCATAFRSKEIWPLLIEKGGDPNLKNSEGKTASQLLQEMNQANEPEKD